MKFSGLQKTSLSDYPDEVASVLFTPGCNLRCPFCHNWRIVVDPKPPFLNEEDALSVLESRKRYVDAVVVSGGEPTLHKELPRFLKRLKERGFKVKLDTNGFYPRVLEECLPYVDYVALDVKTSLEKYGHLGEGNTADFLKTVELLKTGKVPYEFRTTVVPGFVDAEDVKKIGEIVKGAQSVSLQQFVPDDTLDKNLQCVKPYTEEKMRGFGEEIKKFVGSVSLKT
jgi:pyruvate formate lyase activating enzyme